MLLADTLFAPAHHRPSRLQPRPPRHARLAGGLDGRTTAALRARGIERPSPIRRRRSRPLAGEHFVVVTPTASGKTVCYNAPVLDAVLKDPSARALYLFPTKALAQDQVAELQALAAAPTSASRRTPTTATRRGRRGRCPPGRADRRHEPGHAACGDAAAPHLLGPPLQPPPVHRHRRVARLPGGLRQACRQCTAPPAPGLPLLRQRPVHPLLGDDRQSAGIGRANRRGAGDADRRQRRAARREARHLLQPAGGQPRPWPARQRGADRRSLAAELLGDKVQTIVFARSGVVELLPTYLRERAAAATSAPSAVPRRLSAEPAAGDRARLERRRVLGVVSTNALELGVDIGGLDAVSSSATPARSPAPGSRRVGPGGAPKPRCAPARRPPLDQYIIANPDYFFGSRRRPGWSTRTTSTY